MAQIQWNRYLSRLYDHAGGAMYEKILIDCMAGLLNKGRTSPKQGDWLAQQMEMHLGMKLEHTGQVVLTKAQWKCFKEFAQTAMATASNLRRRHWERHFPHQFHAVPTPIPHRFHTESANTPVESAGYQPYIDKISVKYIDGPLAQSDGLFIDLRDGGSLGARHQGCGLPALPIAANDNVPDDASSPLRVAAAQSDKSLGIDERPTHSDSDTTTAKTGLMAWRRKMAKSNTATISLWVDRGAQSHVQGHLEVGGERYRLSFRAPNKIHALLPSVATCSEDQAQWVAEVKSHLIPNLVDKAHFAEGRFPKKHMVSVIHDGHDTLCKRPATVCGMAIMKYSDGEPASCGVEVDGLIWNFHLLRNKATNPKAPQFKASAVPADKAA